MTTTVRATTPLRQGSRPLTGAAGMQHEVLAILTADEGQAGGGYEAEYHRQMIDVLNSGYTSEYYKTFQMIQPEMTTGTVRWSTTSSRCSQAARVERPAPER